VTGAAISLFMLVSAAVDAPPIALDYWAVQAVQTNAEEQSFDAELRPIVGHLQDLPHSRFHHVTHGSMVAAFGERTDARLHERYLLFVEPQSWESEGRARIRICLEMRSERDPEKLVKAVDSRVVIAPDNPIRLGGLKLDGGDLVVLIKTAGR